MSPGPVLGSGRGDSRMQENRRWQGHHLSSSNSQGSPALQAGSQPLRGSGSCRVQPRLTAEPRVWAHGRGFLTLLGQISAQDSLSLLTPPILDSFLLKALVPAAPWLGVGPEITARTSSTRRREGSSTHSPSQLGSYFFSSSRTCVSAVAILYCTH